MMLRILLLILLVAGQTYGASFEGLLVKVSDGDTVQVMHNGKAEKIRLAEIDCPEKDQPYGQAAKKFVLKVAAQKTVKVEIETTDRYGRTVGHVYLPDGTNLNRELVKQGYAWWYRQYSKDASIGQLEDEARSAKRGLWQDKEPVAPWEWRKGKRSATRSVAESAEASVSGPYHGNVNSRIFHREGCRYYDCKSCTTSFPSRDKAIAAGYKACKVCGP